MSIRTRLSRAKLSKNLPEIYKNLPDQTARIIQEVKDSLTEARNYYDKMPDTWAEWDRLRTNNTFKNEARPECIYSFDAFVGEFGTCTKGRIKLRKLHRSYKTWTRHTTIWSNRQNEHNNRTSKKT